jgi:hypothetical protein
MAEHILITGTGRSGTTLLVQILTHLDFDTGYTRQEALENVDAISRAGLERSLFDLDLPHVAKSPWFADEIEDALAGGLRVETIIIPFRRLFDAAESRRHVFREAERLGKNPVTNPGSLWKVTDASDQEQALALQFYKLLEPVVASAVPVVFVSFPRFVEDPDYLYDQLADIFERRKVSREAVRAVHAHLADPIHVHRFEAPAG